MKSTPLLALLTGLLIPALTVAQTNLIITAPNSVTPGAQNVIFGPNAGNQTIAGNKNTFIGHSTGTVTTTGENNVFVGGFAGYGNTSGTYNTFVGLQAGVNNTSGNNNVFSGSGAGESNKIGGQNVFIGYASGQLNVSGENNAFLGMISGRTNPTGSNNSGVGCNSGSQNKGSFNTFIGSNSDVKQVDGNPGINYSTAIGANAKVSISNAIVLGDSAINTKVGIGITAPQFTLDVKGIINIRGNGTLKFSHLSNPTYRNGQTDQVLTVDADGSTVLAQFSGKQVNELTESVNELRTYLIQIKQENEVLKRRVEQLEKERSLVLAKSMDR